MHYDADNQILAISVRTWPVWKEEESKDSTRNALDLKTKSFNGDEYTGTNAFGATAKVQSIFRDEYELALPNLADFSTKAGMTGTDLFVRLTMQPAIAREAKGDVRVLAVCRLAAPLATSALLTQTPTLDNPRQIVTQLHYIHAQLLQLWIYDLSSGKIFAKVQPRTAGPQPGVVTDPNCDQVQSNPVLTVRALIACGEGLAKQGRGYEALQRYQSALEIQPKKSLASFRVGEGFFFQKAYYPAVRPFQDALAGDCDPKWIEVWSHIYLGKIYDLLGQRERAVSEYVKAKQTRDDTAGAQQEADEYLARPYTAEMMTHPVYP